MGPIEVLYITIGLLVALVGVARGYVKELGSTLIILVTVFLLTFFQEQLNTALTAVGGSLLGFEEEAALNTLLSVFYTVVFAAIVFAGYAGRTLSFNGQPAPPPEGTILSLLIGLLNGYLIAGTLWYYQHVYSYPLGTLVGFDNQLTERAQTLVEYLPPALFESPVYWIVPVAVLLVIRVRG